MQSRYTAPTPPDNYLIWAILTTVFCCMPLGIVAIVKASNVNSLWSQGRYEEAMKAAKDARRFSLWSALLAGIPLILYIAFLLLGFLFGISSALLNV